MTDETTQHSESKKKSNVYNRLLETYLWLIISMLIFFPAIYSYFRSGEFYLLEFYNQFLLGVLFFILPTLFKLIFGKLPIEYLRSKREQNQDIRIEGDKNIVHIHQDAKNELKNYLEICIEESKSISERIFTRSGVYLLVGCLIAFTGVAIFYSPIFEKSKATDITQRLLDYLPRFGSLFFIEFVAFFFLKQYRIMLEEYRYYEAIKRNRQDNFNFIDLIDKYMKSPDVLKIVVDKMTQNNISKMTNGETTEILETQKIVNQDLDLFAKVSEMIKTIKEK